MCVLVEASHEDDQSKIQETWDLLADLYAANSTLSQLSEDRRRHHAADIVVAAWKARQHKLGSDRISETPAFVADLEAQLLHLHAQPATSPDAGPTRLDPEIHPPEHDFAATFDLDLTDIDWDFWSTVD